MLQNLIPANDFCTHHQVEVSFLYSLKEYGLLKLYTEKEAVFVDEEELQKLEQLMHLHYDLNINLEGIDAINNLLAKLDAAQNELIMLKNRLNFFEKGQL